MLDSLEQSCCASGENKVIEAEEKRLAFSLLYMWFDVLLVNSCQRSLISLSRSTPKPLCLPCGEPEQYGSCHLLLPASCRRKDVKLRCTRAAWHLAASDSTALSEAQTTRVYPPTCLYVFFQTAQAARFRVRRWHQKLHLLQRRQLHRPRAVLWLPSRLHWTPVGKKRNERY